MKCHNTIIALLAFAAGGVVQSASAAALDEGLADIVHTWEHINFELPEKQRSDAYAALEQRADALSKQFPDRAEPLVWEGIVYSSHAGVAGLSALGLAKNARKCLEAAEKIEPDALQGSIFTSLGTLYYKVPGWPIGFGDDDKAESYLKRALQVDPDGIDSNYFWGDFQFSQHHYAEALTALQKADAAPPRPDRQVSDAGRHAEIRTLLGTVREKVGNGAAGG